MKKLINKKGFTIVSLFFYVLSFLIITIISFNLLKTVVSSNKISTDTISFNNEKNQIYSILDKHSNHIVDGSVNTNTIIPTDIPINIKNTTEKERDILSYKIIDTKYDGDGVTEITTDVMFEERATELLYTTKETVKNSDGTIIVKEEEELSFYSISDVKFSKINKICTDETITTGCIDVLGLIDVTLYNEKEVMGRLSLNKSKRSFYFGEN